MRCHKNKLALQSSRVVLAGQDDVGRAKHSSSYDSTSDLGWIGVLPERGQQRISLKVQHYALLLQHSGYTLPPNNHAYGRACFRDPEGMKYKTFSSSDGTEMWQLCQVPEKC